MQQNPKQQTCSKCKQIKSLDQYHRDKNKRSGHVTTCKECACLVTKLWREKNLDRHKASVKKYAENNPEKIRQIQRELRRKQRADHPEATMVSAAKTRAKSRDLEFNLSPEDIIIPDMCPLLGVRLERSQGKKSPSSPSLDRIDPRRGYTKDNVWVISQRANVIKNDASPAELIHIGKVLSSLYPHLSANDPNQIQNKPSKETV